MPLYIPDFLADTMHLSAAETGAYLCLIMDYWLHDGLPDDDNKLAQIARLPIKSWRMMRPTIEAFFRPGWRHKRIDAEIVKMIGMIERRQAAGSKGGTVSSMRRSNSNSSNASSNASSKRAANHQANEQQTAKQNASNDPSKNEANVQHSTKKESITTTSLDTARARENPTKSITPSDDLVSVIQKKGWVQS